MPPKKQAKSLGSKQAETPTANHGKSKQVETPPAPQPKSLCKSIQFNQKDHTNDMLLLVAVTGKNPFGSQDKWQEVADDLNEQLKPLKLATHRTVRERTNLVLKKFKQKNAASLKDSGPQEDYSDFDNMCQEVVDLEYEWLQGKEENAKAKKKAAEDAIAGEHIRKKAMETLGDDEDESSAEEGSEEDSSPGSSEAENVPVQGKKGKKRPTPKTKSREDPLFEFMRKKQKLEEKKEKRRRLELEERREERRQNMELFRSSMALYGYNPEK